MDNFTPVPALLGGILIGISASIMLLANGRICGISGILGRVLPRNEGSAARVAFLLGLTATGMVLSWVDPSVFTNDLSRSVAALIVSGFLVGFGTRLGNGCTSGHGICGLSRLSGRGLTATLTFMTAGAMAAAIITQLFSSFI